MKHKHDLLGAVFIISLFFVTCKKEDSSTTDNKSTATTATTTTTSTPGATDAKSLALKDYNDMYVGSIVTSFTWNGNTSNCIPGTLSQDVFDKALLRLKYFRKAAGLPIDGITMEANLSAKCQKDALMTKVNNKLDHFPDTTWSCYSADGAEAAGKGNIAIGASDVSNITLWMEDEGANNAKVGHRRWILYSRASMFGFGCTDKSGTLWVINNGVASLPLATTMPEYTAWPPKGFVPRNVVFPRWSLSIPAASYPYNIDFTAAAVVMTDASGANIPLTIEYANPIENTYMGDNTIIWRPTGINVTSDADQKYTVKVSNVTVNGVTKNYQYDVTIFKP
jgi:hypothetical protein